MKDFEQLVALGGYSDAPQATRAFVYEAASPLRPQDADRFWYLDFHWPRGLTPMGSLFLDDCYAWGTQFAAAQLPLPAGNGLAARLAGTHVYASQMPTDSGLETRLRAVRAGGTVLRFLANFTEIWRDRVAELDAGFEPFRALEPPGSLSEIRDLLLAARQHQRRAWEIHFEVMYPLLANYLEFRAVCLELGLDAGLPPVLLQGRDNVILACDRALWTLVRSARERGLASHFARAAAADVLARLRAEPAAAGWLEELDLFLAEFGWRTEGIADVALAPWIEDCTPVLNYVESLLAGEGDHDFAAKATAADGAREAALRDTRARLSPAQREIFEAALSRASAANFSWWNDEHNHYIDLRATIPLRMACLALGRALGLSRPDDILFLFWEEALALCAGQISTHDIAARVSDRRLYYAACAAERALMPPVTGAVPTRIEDPIMIEIFGIDTSYLATLRAGAAVGGMLKGIAASPGIAVGPAVVLRSADDLHKVRDGMVLVCEATSPNWTPAFTRIAACVCDVGGALTHAAIVAREYRVPCVVGVGNATSTIQDGDIVEVDGAAGAVRLVTPVERVKVHGHAV